MGKRRKIGIMGGSFNPIHYGHLLMAENARQQYDLDKVWFMPNGNPPHKDGKSMLDAETRCIMTELAIYDNKYFVLSRHETDKENVSYTYNTLTELTRTYKDTEFYFIMGGDSIDYFEDWAHPEIISKLCVILVAARDDVETAKLESRISEISGKYGSDIRIISSPPFDVSSNMIRERVSKGISIKYLLPSEVEEYIMEHNLYE